MDAGYGDFDSPNNKFSPWPCAQCRGTGWRSCTESYFGLLREIPGIKEPCGSCERGRKIAEEHNY
jgi:hypothetical protein